MADDSILVRITDIFHEYLLTTTNRLVEDSLDRLKGCVAAVFVEYYSESILSIE